MIESYESEPMPTRDALAALFGFAACAFHAGCALALAIFLMERL